MNDTAMEMMRLAAKGYSCGQILMCLALQARAETNSGLVRSMAGLAYGCGTGLGTCGALTGGSCVLALYAGKGSDDETASEKLPLMLQELSDWFQERVGETCGDITCEAVVGEAGPAAARQKCGAIVAETHDKVMEILMANGFDPAG